MLASGIFVTPTAKYGFYEVKESGFYRFDLVQYGAEFQTQFDKVVYSIVRRKSVLVLGDSKPYDEYLYIKNKIESTYMKTEKKSEWQDGVYVTHKHSYNEKLGYVMDTVLNNNTVTEMTLMGEGYQIVWIVTDPVYGLKLAPMNIGSYQNLKLSKDTVTETVSGVVYSMETLKRKFDLDHIDRCDCVVATDLETARRRLKMFDEDPYPFRGFDTETTGLDFCLYGEDKLVGVVLGHNPTTATYFPFRHDGDFNLPLNFLNELMQVVYKHQDHSVAQNKKFDREVMMSEGFDVRIKWDTMEIAIILNPVLQKGVHALKTLAGKLTNNHYLELDEIFINEKDINFAVLGPEHIKYYACPDGYNVLAVFDDQMRKLPKIQAPLAELECDLTDVKADQEYFGIRVDRQKFEHMYVNVNYVLDMLLTAFRKLTHEDGNIDSKQVLSNLIYNKMHCKVLSRTETGLPSTSKNTIKKLSEIQRSEPAEVVEDMIDLDGNVIIKGDKLAKSAYPALVILTKYSEYHKLKTAFFARFERTMRTGRVFFWVNQNGAATGRQSSPMHQLPPMLKDCILSDAEDRDFWGPDYSQIELRMMAYLSNEPELKEMCKDPDNDIHRVIGSLISGKEMWEITPEERSIGKRRNFGVVYLISGYGLAGQIFGPGYTAENVQFCKDQLDQFFHRFKRIDRFIKGNSQLVKKRGYMETKWFHRKRLFPEVFDPNIEPRKLSSIIRMANNVPVQGTAADYLKLAEVLMYQYIRDKGWYKFVDGFPMVRIMLSIHDELIISAHNSIPYEEIIEMIVRCMQTPVEDAPPFFVQPARMDNWGGHSDDAVAMPIRFRDKVIEDYHKTGVSVFKQSYFRLQIPEDIAIEIHNSREKVPDIVKKYADKVTLVFEHGDYVKEFTQEHVKEALKNYVVSRFTLYRIDNYLDLLNNYRHEQLDIYMNDLISKYGTDYQVVGSHVRHPSLTFQLLDVYAKRIPRDAEHVDRIVAATKCYIDDMLSGSKNKTTFVANIDYTPVTATDKDTYTESLDVLVNYDNDGNIVLDPGEELEEVYDPFDDPCPDDIISATSAEPTYVWELLDTVIFDVQNLSMDSVNEVLKFIFKYKQPDGFLSAKLLYNDELLDTGMWVEQLDFDLANNLIHNLQEKILC